MQNLPELQKHGLFFSFTTDPMLYETIPLTGKALLYCLTCDIPVKILSKIGNFEMVYFPFIRRYLTARWIDNSKISFGFTLTGHDELEPKASTNQERIEAIEKLHNTGFKTWVSLEPIIDLKSSMDMIKQTIGYCDEYKIGLLSGDKTIKKDELQKFFDEVNILATTHNFNVYWKDSIKNKLK